jgi:hypothetical protein
MTDHHIWPRSIHDAAEDPVSDGTQPSKNWTEFLSRVVWAAAAGACLALCVHVIKKARFSGWDSWLPMSRALDFLHGSSSGLLYDELFFSQHIKFQYPPSGLLMLDLLRWMGVTTFAQYNAINAGALIISGFAFALFAVQVLGPIRLFGVRLPVGPVAFFTALRFYPDNFAFQLGQMQLVLGLLFVLACLSLLHDRRLLAGCLIAFAATVKPQFLPLGLLALWNKDWRFLIGLGTVTGAALVLSIGLYGWNTQLDYLKVLDFLTHHGEYLHTNQSVGGILIRFLYHGPSLDLDPNVPVPQSAFPPYIPVTYYATILSSLVMLAIPFIVRPKKADRMSDLLYFCAASILFTMASPIAWIHHYNILLPAYVVAFQVIRDRRQGTRTGLALILLGLSFVLTGYPLIPADNPTAPSLNLIQSHVFIGACILVAVILVEIVSRPRSLMPNVVGNPVSED